MLLRQVNSPMATRPTLPHGVQRRVCIGIGVSGWLPNSVDRRTRVLSLRGEH